MKKTVTAFPATERMDFMAREIHSYLRSDLRHGNGFLASPFVIEFTGNPDSGKTSAIKSLYTFLRRHDFRVKKPLEGAEEISDDIPRSSPEFNLATGIYALDFLIREHHMHTHDVVILDRGIYDAYWQMEAWLKKGKLEDDEKKSYQNFFLSRFWTPRINACYIMVCDPVVAIKRTKRESRTNVLGGSTTPESIAYTRERCLDMYATLKDQHPLHLVDTSRMSRGDVADTVNSSVLEVLLAHVHANQRKHK